MWVQEALKDLTAQQTETQLSRPVSIHSVSRDYCRHQNHSEDMGPMLALQATTGHVDSLDFS